MDGRLEPVELVPKYIAAPPVPAEVWVRPLSGRARLGRAAGRLALAWTGAALGVFVPLLHFVLVPSLLVGGVAWAVLSLRAGVRLGEDAELPCPRCPATLRAGNVVGWPAVLVCPGCGNAIAVRPRAPG